MDLRVLLLTLVPLVLVQCQSPTIVTNQGSLNGIELKSRGGRTFWGYLGIPYATAKRFATPERAPKWEGVRNATEYGPNCLQFNLPSMGVVGSEDCLSVNVFTPLNLPKDEGKSLPVLVHFHSGAFFYSSGSEYGANYLLDEDVVLVTFNYRLGPFGFLSTGDSAIQGNFGLKDQVELLRWVKDNIASFGGDPGSVTLFGVGGGSAAISLHVQAPSSSGLFHKAILQSGNTLCPWAIERNPLETTRTLGRYLNCPIDSIDLLSSCLKGKDAQEIVSQVPKFFQWFLDPIAPFAPSVEAEGKDSFLSRDPASTWTDGPINKVPILMGMVRDEGAVQAGMVLANPLFVMQLDKEWSTFAPITLGIEAGKKGSEAIEKVRNFYFGSEVSIGPGTVGSLTKMYTDRNYAGCTHEGATKHSKHATTYLYVYTFKDQAQTGLNPLGVDTGKYIGHGEELAYLMPNPKISATPFEVNSTSDLMSKRMANLWASFAANGSPSASWAPVSQPNLKWQELNLESRELEISRAFSERLNFWKSLDLTSKDSPVLNDIGADASGERSKFVRQISSATSTTARAPTTSRRPPTTTRRTGLLGSLLGGNRQSGSGGGFLSRIFGAFRSVFQFFANLARSLFARVRGLFGGARSAVGSSGGGGGGNLLSSLGGGSGSQSLF